MCGWCIDGASVAQVILSGSLVLCAVKFSGYHDLLCVASVVSFSPELFHCSSTFSLYFILLSKPFSPVGSYSGLHSSMSTAASSSSTVVVTATLGSSAAPPAVVPATSQSSTLVTLSVDSLRALIREELGSSSGASAATSSSQASSSTSSSSAG